MHQDFQRQLLERHLRTHLGEVDPAAMAFLRDRLEWVAIAAGETLMSQGDPGESIYMSVSGRLRAYIRDDSGVERLVRELTRGQIIGEMSMYTGEPRSATVIAVRDSVLVKLGKTEFAALLASSAQMSIALTRQIIKRLQNAHSRPEIARPGTIGVLAVSAGVQAQEFCQRLAGHLQRVGRVQVVDAARVERELEQPGLARIATSDAAVNRRIALYLDKIEAGTDFLLLVGDDQESPWSRRCRQHCDELLLLADASQHPGLQAFDRTDPQRRPGVADPAEFLVLLHDAQLRCPAGTRQWLEHRPFTGHYHIRPALERDMARLARLVSGTAVGLVFGGGGARGSAHLGIYRALQERNIEVDWVGGTSVGAVMATFVASDRPYDEIMKIARASFSVNPTGDYNLIPLISLIKGARLRRVVDSALRQLFGRQPDVEDLWKNYYCIASNYSQASEQLIQRGDLARAIRASIAIPGALPPVIQDGDLLCDGGTFNNFPVDVMRSLRGIGKVIGVDLSIRKPRRIEHTELPGNWSLLRDRLRPRERRRFRLPSLISYLMNVTILYSSSRRHEYARLTDLYFNPPLARVGMLGWDRFDSIVQQGHAHGVQVLDALRAEDLLAYRPQATNP